jgi:hypothetical protein
MICQGICISVTATGGRLAEWAFRWPQQPNPFFVRLKASREPSRVSLRRHPRAPARKLPLAFPSKEPLAKRHAGLRSHQGKTSENSLNTVRFRRSAEHASFDFVQAVCGFVGSGGVRDRSLCVQHFSFAQIPFSRLGSGHPLFQWPSPQKQTPSIQGRPGRGSGNLASIQSVVHPASVLLRVVPPLLPRKLSLPIHESASRDSRG